MKGREGRVIESLEETSTLQRLLNGKSTGREERERERSRMLSSGFRFIGLEYPYSHYVGNDGVWPRQGVCEGGY